MTVVAALCRSAPLDSIGHDGQNRPLADHAFTRQGAFLDKALDELQLSGDAAFGNGMPVSGPSHPADLEQIEFSRAIQAEFDVQCEACAQGFQFFRQLQEAQNAGERSKPGSA